MVRRFTYFLYFIVQITYYTYREVVKLICNRWCEVFKRQLYSDFISQGKDTRTLAFEKFTFHIPYIFHILYFIFHIPCIFHVTRTNCMYIYTHTHVSHRANASTDNLIVGNPFGRGFLRSNQQVFLPILIYVYIYISVFLISTNIEICLYMYLPFLYYICTIHTHAYFT